MWVKLKNDLPILKCNEALKSDKLFCAKHLNGEGSKTFGCVGQIEYAVKASLHFKISKSFRKVKKKKCKLIFFMMAHRVFTTKTKVEV